MQMFATIHSYNNCDDCGKVGYIFYPQSQPIITLSILSIIYFKFHPKECFSRSRLRAHLMIHSDRNPFECTFCGKVITLLDLLHYINMLTIF